MGQGRPGTIGHPSFLAHRGRHPCARRTGRLRMF